MEGGARRVAWVLAAAILPGLPAAAALAGDGWEPLDGDGIRRALTERRLNFAGGGWQTFAEDGGTMRQDGGLTRGRWEVRGDRFCAIFPPAEDWTCHAVARNAQARSIRFTAGDGTTTEGIYSD